MALEAIDSCMPVTETESVSLEHCLGRVLRENIFAERDNPPFDRVCMDGIAIASSTGARGGLHYRVGSTQAAGAPAVHLSNAADAVEVMTGAVLPQGADCVVPLEEYDLAGGIATLHPGTLLQPYRNVQRRGADSRPDEPMLSAGIRLGGPEIAVIASAGRASVLVSRHTRIAVVSTGDELVEPGLPIAEHQVRRSNAHAITATLRAHGFTQVSDDHIRDDGEALSQRLTLHLDTHDVLVLSGGVSKGRFDLVPGVLKNLGVKEVFQGIEQGPGRPMWFGLGPRGQVVFGLPGNPNATLFCLVRYTLRALTRAAGASPPEPEPVTLAAAVKRGRSVSYFLPVTLEYDAQGRHLALPHTPKGSGDFLALAGTAGFVELPPRTEGYPAGFVAPLYRW